jgi:polyisoprenoid-binding protein YceI
MRKVILILSLAFISSGLFAQKKTTTSAIVAFDASTSLDRNPKAENKTVVAAVDTKTGLVQFEAAVKNFAFSNPSMQQHFNGKNWMNSDEFPAFTFKGNILNLSDINFSKDGSYTANVEGLLTVRGKEQKIKVPATVVVKGSGFTASSDFTVKLSDFDITGGSVDSGKVSKEPKISVSADFN